MSAVFKRFKLKQKIFLCAIVAGLIGWLAFWLAILPQWARLGQARAQYHQEAQQVRAVEAFVRNHPDQSGHLAALARQQAALNRALPDSAAVSDYLAQLEAAASISGVRLTHVKPALPADKGGYKETRLEVAVNGSFFQLLNFVKMLDDGPRLSTIAKLAIHAKPGGLENTFIISVYSVN